MEAATERINSASWREKFYRSCDSYPTNGRLERRIVGTGAEVLYKSLRYYDTSTEDSTVHQDGGPKEYLRKWRRGSSASTATAFQQWHAQKAKDMNPVTEYLLVQADQILDPSLPREIFLSQFKDEVFLTSATHSVCPLDETLSPFQENVQSPHAVKSERLSPATSCSIKSEDSSQSATTSPGLTTELENFQDLTAWCHRLAPKPLKMSVPLETDELNTPIIEYGDFIFQSPPIDQSNDNCYGLLNVHNYDELLHATNNADGLYIQNDDASFDGIQINKHDTNNISCQLFGQSNLNNSIRINKDETTYQYFINNIGGGESKKNTTTTLMDNNSSLNNIFNTKCADNILYNNNNSEEFQSQQLPQNVFALTQDSPVFELNETVINTQDDVIVLPLENVTETETETVVHNNNSVNTRTGKNLQLDFSNIWTSDKLTPTDIDTPEVINTALALDKSFNLINFITNDSLKDTPSIQSTSNGPQFEDESRSTTTNDPDPSYTPSEASDDEDYEPPSKQSRKTTTSRSSNRKTHSKKLIDISDSDLSNMSTATNATIDPALKVVRRGRPPKRNVSISSESTNADSEVSRYRELRDKNNEASRRSRLNRKMKEISLEEEAKDLDVRNRKLKVQVQEMERQVNTLRQNLMQMLLKK